MNPRDRFLTTLRGGKADRVPLLLEAFHFATRQEVEQLDDPGRREIAERVFDEMVYRVPVPTQGNRLLMTDPRFIHHVSREVDANGNAIVTRRIETPKGDLFVVTGRNEATETVWTVKYPVESLEDIDRIRSVPWQLSDRIGPPDTSNLPEDFARRGYVASGVSSPFVCVAGMMSYEMFLELCAVEPDLMEELTELCCRRAMANLDAILPGRKVEYLWMGGCEWLTPPMASPATYARLVQPYEKQLIDRMHAGGALSHVHCHGNVRDTMELAIQRGADYFEPCEPPPDGDIPFAEAKRLAAGRMTLGGNIEARILECGTVEETEAAVRAAFEGPLERMILQTTAGPLGRMTARTVKNYHKMIDLWEELSPL